MGGKILSFLVDSGVLFEMILDILVLIIWYRVEIGVFEVKDSGCIVCVVKL